jgi:beta-propeller repeat-containing protein
MARTVKLFAFVAAVALVFFFAQRKPSRSSVTSSSASTHLPSHARVSPAAAGEGRGNAWAGDQGKQPRVDFMRLPLSFEANRGQTDSRVKFLSRGSDYTLFLTGDEAVLALRNGVAQGSSLIDAALRRSWGLGTHRHGTPLVSPPFPPLIPQSAGGISGALAGLERPQGQRTDPALQERLRPGEVLRLKFVGANPKPKVIGLDPLPGKSNYFIGNDPKKWRTDVPNYAKVRYKDMYPGIDLVYYGNPSTEGQLEYDFIVAPGADPKAITLGLGGPVGAIHESPLRIDPSGDMVIQTDGGEVRFHKPVMYQPVAAVGVYPGGAEDRRSPLAERRYSVAARHFPKPPRDGASLTTRHLLDGRYVLTADNHVHFEVPDYDKTWPLVIDPALAYSTFLGGSGSDFGDGIALDSSGNAYVTGSTTSTDFPTTGGATQTTFAGGGTVSGDAFVAKLSTDGSSLMYSTYLGGSGPDSGFGIAVDPSGNAYVTGYTGSTDFPTTSGAVQRTKGGFDGSPDAFVAKLSADGSSLTYSTYLGGSGFDIGQSIAVDAFGSAYITGFTDSADFPATSGARQTNFGGGAWDAFVTKLSADGSSLKYSTYLGGSGYDQGQGIAVDSSGDAYVTGDTCSTDFPTSPGAFDTKCATCNCSAEFGFLFDGFVAKLSANGSSLAYSTYLGGSNSDLGLGIVLDPSGNAYVVGETASSDFPTTFGAARTTNSGSFDAFVTKLSADGSSLAYSTYLGGSDDDLGEGIAVDTSGNAYVTGETHSTNFPTTIGAEQTTFAGGFFDAFVAKLSGDGSLLTYSTYLGGSGADAGEGIAVGSSGNAYVAGWTASSDFPITSGAEQTKFGGGFYDAFVAKISPPLALMPQNLVFEAQVVGTTSNAQAVWLTAAGGAALTISGLSASGDFAVASTGTTCSVSSPVSGGASCTINVSFTPTANGSRTGALTLNDSDPTSPQTVPLAGTGEDFGVAVASGSPSTETVTAGGTSTYMLGVSPLGGFNQTVNLSCTGAPSLSTCTPSPAAVTLDGTNAATVNVTVTTTAPTLVLPRALRIPPRFYGPLLFWPFGLAMLLAVAATSHRRRRPRESGDPWIPASAGMTNKRFAMKAGKLLAPSSLGLALLMLLAWAACGGGGGATVTHNPGTPAGTYTLTITATSGNLSHSTTVSLTVK